MKWLCENMEHICALCKAKLKLKHIIVFTCYKFVNFKFFPHLFCACPKRNANVHKIATLFMYSFQVWHSMVADCHIIFRNKTLIYFATSDTVFEFLTNGWLSNWTQTPDILGIAEISQHAVSFPDDVISLDTYGKSSGTMNHTYFF
jgi:hypothetical protein